MAWGDDYTVKVLELTMYGYRYVHGLDLTYDVLGHVVRDGNVVGIMTEPMLGRMMQPCDRNIVYTAVSKMEARNVVHMGPASPDMLIHNGKVRLTNLACVRFYGKHQQVEFRATANKRHWEFMEGEFARMDGLPFLYIPNPMRNKMQDIHILPAVPSPERPLRVEIHAKWMSEPYLVDMMKAHREQAHKIQRLRAMHLSIGSPIPETPEAEHSKSTKFALESDVETPYSSIMTTNRTRTRRSQHAYQPYRTEKSTSRKLLLA
jgi:hypothetical protein